MTPTLHDLAEFRSRALQPCPRTISRWRQRMADTRILARLDRRGAGTPSRRMVQVADVGRCCRAARVTGAVVRRHKAVTPYMFNIEKG